MSDSPNQGRFSGRWFIPAAIVIALLLVLVVVLVIVNQTSSSRTPVADPTSAAPTTNTSPVPDEDKSVCGLKGYETTNTLSGPPSTSWKLVGSVAAPNEPKGAGPGTIASDGFRTCYAHTAKGALFAAANILAMGSDANLGAELSDKLVVPGPGRDAAMKSSSGASTDGPRVQIAGYRVLDYNGDGATVDIAVTISNGDMASIPTQLRWSGGDWKVVLTDNGQPPVGSSALSNLGGYTPWSGA
jgi:hypothetical protein